jgi:hypothetical protein
MTSMTKTIESGGSAAAEGRAFNAAEAPALAAQAGVPPTPQGAVVIVGDPRKDEGAFERFVEAVSELYQRHEEVWVVYYHGGGLTDYVAYRMVAPRLQRGSGDYAVILDEDGVPLFVVDFSAMTWDSEIASALLSLAPEPEEVVRVVVEPGKGW